MYNTKTNRQKQDGQEDQNTFKPNISETSRNLDRNYYDKYFKKNAQYVESCQQEECESNEGYQESQLPENRYEILYNLKKLQDLKKQNLTAQHQQELDNQFTFTPEINEKSKQNRDVSPYFDRLYTKIPKNQTVSQQQLFEEQRTKLSLKEKEELKNCTFAPSINTEMNLNQPVQAKPNGYDVAIDRMKKGYSLQKAKKKQLETINMPKNVKHDKEPFNFASEQRQFREIPFIYIDVELNGGKTGRIGIKENDNAEEVAHNFAKIYSLNQKFEKQLVKKIKCFIDKHIEEQN